MKDGVYIVYIEINEILQRPRSLKYAYCSEQGLWLPKRYVQVLTVRIRDYDISGKKKSLQMYKSWDKSLSKRQKSEGEESP